MWINGKTVGIDWLDIETTPGFAFLTAGSPSGYNDPTAILTGTWGPDQYVRTVVKFPTPDLTYIQEVEIRLRSTITARSNTGYEVLAGNQIVRWNGAIGDFTVLPDTGPYGNVYDGDVFEARMVGNTITVYINGAQVNSATDNTYSSGNPGMGFFTRNPAPTPFGFSSFTASNNPIP